MSLSKLGGASFAPGSSTEIIFGNKFTPNDAEILSSSSDVLNRKAKSLKVNMPLLSHT